MLSPNPEVKESLKNNGAIEPVSFEICPAKSYEPPSGDVLQGRSVFNHCQIVGGVAKEIIARFPSKLRNILFPKNSPMAAAAHDVGKISPYFVEKILRACRYGLKGIKPNPHLNVPMEMEWGGHAGVSQLTTKAINIPEYVPEVLGQHHGTSPRLGVYHVNDDRFGGPLWQQERVALIDALKKHLDMDWPQIESVYQSRLIAGLTSVSDWIGSGEFFENPESDWESNISKALDDAGFIQPEYKSNLSFKDVFGFDQPQPTQKQLIELVESPGVYILEAPMGDGKTEAALYSAYKMLERGEASGIYFALPTQLTSNKIFERFNEFLDSILSENCKHRSLLLHSNAWLAQTEMGEDGSPGGAWFNQSKRGLLAPFSVGTIDQALMAAMNVKHGFVRAFGLAGKVVILDEVHSYDSYTGTLLEALVELLRELHCTVIILSATLTKERRQELLSRSLDGKQYDGYKLKSDEYPLVTAVPSLLSQRQPKEVKVPALNKSPISIRLVKNDFLAIDEALDRAEKGQQVLWIENTVGAAQKRYSIMGARARERGIDCGLLHSRFITDDRQAIEDLWVNLYGKKAGNKRHTHGRIFFGTQVLEQSLDIDADFLVSAFAPTDMLLQRIGRLWRNITTVRDLSARYECWLLVPDLTLAINEPNKAFGDTAFVYSPYVLCRSLEVWQARTKLILPRDIRELIGNTYVVRKEEGPMVRWLSDLDEGTKYRKGRRALSQLARISLSQSGQTFSDKKAQTRYNEIESVDVLLVKKLTRLTEQKASCLTLLNNQKIILPWQRHKLTKKEWRKLSAELTRHVVSVNEIKSPKQNQVKSLRACGLHHCFYLGHPDNNMAELRVALVDESGTLKGLSGENVNEKYQLTYSSDIGYQVAEN